MADEEDGDFYIEYLPKGTKQWGVARGRDPQEALLNAVLKAIEERE